MGSRFYPHGGGELEITEIRKKKTRKTNTKEQQSISTNREQRAPWVAESSLCGFASPDGVDISDFIRIWSQMACGEVDTAK